MRVALGKIKSLNRQQWLVFFESLFLLPACAISLYFRGFKRTRDSFLPVCAVCSANESDRKVETARQVARAVDLAARYGPYRGNCLKRSLVLGLLLRKRDIDCDLKMGALLSDESLAAHAWIEHFGMVINDHPDVGKRLNILLSDSTRYQKYAR